MFYLLFTVAITLLAYFWYSSKRKALQFWQSRGFPTLSHSQSNFMFGDIGACILRRKNFSEFYRDAHADFKARGHKIGGIYAMNVPMLMIADVDIIKAVLQSDCDAFATRGIDVDVKSNPLAYHLFTIDGEQWSLVRRKLSPAFTSVKLKMMFPIMENHVDALIKMTRTLCDHGNADLIYLDWLNRNGIDIIGNLAFGMDCNTIEGGNEIIFQMTKQIMRPKLWELLKLLFIGFKNPANIVALLSSDEEVSSFFIKQFKDVVQYRQANNVKANDIMQSLISLLEDEEEMPGSGLKMLEITAQAFVFFVAGLEPDSRTINFALYALAQHTDVQSKLRDAIRTELSDNDNEFRYDWIMHNEYLDMVVKEVMRMYPAATNLIRVATKDYHCKDVNLTIPKDTCVIISSLGLHYDREYHEAPLEFRPERFSKRNAQNMNSFANLAFGKGPRFCIGKGFAKMHVKLTLAKILCNFEVLPGTNMKYPLEVNPASEIPFYESKEPLAFKMKPL